MHEDSLVEGMKELMPVYCVIGKIQVWRIEKIGVFRTKYFIRLMRF